MTSGCSAEVGYIFSENVLLIADKRYIGIDKIHSNGLIPKKSANNCKLTEEDKEYNLIISKLRICIEHMNRHIKKFRILSTRYRNRRKKFIMRFSLIVQSIILNYRVTEQVY